MFRNLEFRYSEIFNVHMFSIVTDLAVQIVLCLPIQVNAQCCRLWGERVRINARRTQVRMDGDLFPDLILPRSAAMVLVLTRRDFEGSYSLRI